MITTIEAQEVEKPAHSAAGSLDEKFSPDINDGDEALRLLGVERTTHFSEEYNEKLKRKLVRSILPYYTQNIINTLQDRLIPPLCAAVYFTQFLWVLHFLSHLIIHTFMRSLAIRHL